MAHAGQLIVNPITGEHMTFLQTAADTGGALLRADVTVAPQKAFLPLHIHEFSSERWEVISGRLAVRLGSETLSLGPGEQAIAPAGAAHTWWNADAGDVRFITEVVPPRRMENVFEATAGLARDGKVLVVARRLIPSNPLELALLLRLGGSYAAEPPIPIRVQALVYEGLSALATRLGYPPDFPQYGDVSVGAGVV
ncbi:MAG TPA: cupin domain-containing protein [Chloroflexota bacterium]